MTFLALLVVVLFVLKLLPGSPFVVRAGKIKPDAGSTKLWINIAGEIAALVLALVVLL